MRTMIRQRRRTKSLMYPLPNRILDPHCVHAEMHPLKPVFRTCLPVLLPAKRYTGEAPGGQMSCDSECIHGPRYKTESR